MPRDLTVFNDHALFSGYDASGSNRGLSVTDGTAAGTHELTGISGASPVGVIPNHGFGPNFTVFNGEVLFEGQDAANHMTAGTHELTGIREQWPLGDRWHGR
jgi:hypothetical protein